MVVLQDVNFSHREAPVENVEEFAFDTTDVASTEYPRTQGPATVLDRPIVDILRIPRAESTVNVAEGATKLNTDFVGKYERPQEDALTGPFWGVDEEAFLRSLDIYQRDEDRGYLDFGTMDYI